MQSRIVPEALALLLVLGACEQAAEEQAKAAKEEAVTQLKDAGKQMEQAAKDLEGRREKAATGMAAAMAKMGMASAAR
jgi:hypothetical protein